jgi:hypothetical protein
MQKRLQLCLVMFISGKSLGNKTSPRKAYTLNELLAVMFVIAVGGFVGGAIQQKFGKPIGLLAGILAGLAALGLVCLFYRWSWQRDKRRLTELREKYRTIYRVTALPTDAKNVVKPDKAEIRVGDYGWEARPNRKDGLIHLQGLTPRWTVVWHAGFRPDQIEKVAEKTASQYDYWIPYWAKTPTPPPCPYPVQERNTPTMGLPHHSGHYFKDYPSQGYPTSNIEAAK